MINSDLDENKYYHKLSIIKDNCIKVLNEDEKN